MKNTDNDLRIIGKYIKILDYFSVLILLIFALFILLLGGCASVEIPKFKAHVTLPASGDGYWVETLGTAEGRIPKAEWDQTRKRGIIVLSEDWAILRSTIMKNCLTLPCKESIGVFDELFYTLDDALKKVQK